MEVHGFGKNVAHSRGQRGALGCRLCLRTHCSEGRSEAGQTWPGLGTQAGRGPVWAGQAWRTWASQFE